MEMNELQQKTDAELRDLLAQAQDAVRDLRFRANNGQLQKVHEVKLAKRMVAQIMTILNDRANNSTNK